jgi:hypothetical protein
VRPPTPAIWKIRELVLGFQVMSETSAIAGTKDSRELEGSADRRGHGGSIQREGQQTSNERRTSAKIQLMTVGHETAATW